MKAKAALMATGKLLLMILCCIIVVVFVTLIQTFGMMTSIGVLLVIAFLGLIWYRFYLDEKEKEKQ
jgi:Flp pilus assembly protein TadB